MGNLVGAFLGIILILSIWFPETAGHGAHRWFNAMKTGWEQVQDK